MNTDFRTVLNPPPSPFRMRHGDGVWMIGSCFTENIGSWLSKFRCDVFMNPHGILYNPVSIAEALRDTMRARVYTEKDLHEHQGIWHSFSHHGKFSSANAAEVVDEINKSIQAAGEKLKQAKVLVITFGSAWAYRLWSDGRVVANCHKFPQKTFEKFILKQDVVRALWTEVLQEVSAWNPQIRVVFTVSPVRHLRDGFHENQLSKACLLLTIEDLVQEHPHAAYFPAYELVMDDLRDYRFYASDMIHPSETAIAYVREKFIRWLYDESSIGLFQKLEPLISFLDHRPMKVSAEEHALLVEKKETEIQALLGK